MQASAPPLPALAVDAYPEQARRDILAAHEAAEAAPGDASRVGHLALVLHAWEEFDAATKAYARAQALSPQDVDWWYLGAILASRRGLHDEAARQFRKAHDIRPADALIALRLADASLEAGRPEDAARLYDALATRPEAAPAAFYGLGRVRQLAGDADGARQAFERATSLYPNFGAAHYALAQLQRRARDTAAARMSLQRQQQCLACWPMPPDPWRERLDAVRNDAAALLRRGVALGSHTAQASSDTAAAEAIRLHEAAVADDPLLGQAHVNLVQLYTRTGNLTLAERHYQAARDLPGYEAEAHTAWGWSLLQQRRADEALRVLDEAVRLAPTSVPAQHGRGFALELLERPADAVDAYTRALAGAPTDKDIRFNLARALVRSNRLDEAVTHLERLREPEDANTPRHVFSLAVAHVRRGDIATGIRVAEEALTMARRYGQTDLVQSIERDLASLKAQQR